MMNVNVNIVKNEFYTSQKCCDCRNELKHYKDKNGGEIYIVKTKIKKLKKIHVINVVEKVIILPIVMHQNI
jgi:hypothetical protein